ncbi:hypothetical protein D9M69_472930 [compost metagenome]
MQAVALDLDRQRLLEECRAAHRRHPPRLAGGVAGLVQGQHALAVVAQVEGHVEARQGQALDHFLQVVELGLLGAQELAPRRGVEEQVAHFHRSAHRMGRRLHARLHVAALGLHLPGLLGGFGARGQGQPRHRTDRRQRFAAEAHAHHPLEVVEVADLAGGVALQSQRQVIGGDAGAIVAHLEQLDAALLDIHLDAPRAGVQAVLQQFLGHRGRALDHLAGGDLVGQPRTEQLDAGGVAHGWAARVVAGICRT